MKFDVELSGAVPLAAELEAEPQTMNTEMGQVMQVGSKAEIDPVPIEGSENAVSSGGVHDALAKKMDKENPSGTGAFSVNRKADTTVGTYSVSQGRECEASGNNASIAEGYKTVASGGYGAHAEGYMTTAAGHTSHAEGYKTVAKANQTHAEGYFTIASAVPQHVEGEYNLEDPTPNNSGRGTYAHIIGNGTSESKRSNAHTLDWKGNAWFAGDVYVGSTGGKNKDEGSVRLATLDDLKESGVQFETDETISLKDGVLSVNRAFDVKADNTLPITSAAVATTVGNIEVLLKTI